MRAWILEKRWRIILSGTLIVTAPILGLALFVYVEVSGYFRDNIAGENTLAALNIATHIESELQSDIRNGGLFSSRLLLKEAVRQRDRKNITRHLKSFVEHISSVERALVADPKGILLANYSEDPRLIGKSFSDRDWYKGVSRNWEPYVSEFYLRAGRPQKYLFAMALPIRDADNSVIGVLVLQASENYIQDAMSHIPAHKNQKVYVVDKKGNLIYHPDFLIDRIIDFTGFPSVKKVINGRSGVELMTNPDGAAMLTAFRPVKQWGWGVIVQRPEKEVYASLRKLTLGLFALTAIMLVIGASLAYKRSETIFALKKLSDELEIRVAERTAALAKTNRVLKTLSECNQALVRTEDESKLTENLCRIITEFGGYRLALVGYAEHDENRTVRLVAQSGYEEDFLEKTRLTWADRSSSQGPIGRAIREGAITIFKNLAGDENYPASWREAALKRGYASAIGLPLTAGGEILGAIAIYSAEPDAFDHEEIVLLKELASDMTYGIQAIRIREAHKAAEEALHKSEELFHSTLDNMMEGAQIIGFDWRYLYINDAAEKQNRWPKEELLGRRYMDMWPGIVATEVFAVCRRIMEERTAPHHMENEFTFPDGNKGWYELSIQPVPDGIFILSVDITRRKEAEAEAWEGRERFDRLVKDLNDIVWTSTFDGLQVLDLNESFEKVYGISAEEFRSNPKLWLEMVHPDDRTVAEESGRRLLEQGTATAEYRIVRPDGEVRWLHDRKSMLRDEQGRPVQIGGIARDITDSKQKDIFIKNVFESMGEGLVVVDPQYRILAANKEYCRLAHVRLEEIIGRHCYEVTHHAERQCTESGIECPPYLTFQTGRPHTAVHEMKDETGAPNYHEIKSYPMKDESGEVRSVIEIITDITEKRKMEAQYYHAQKMESVGTLAGGVAHDFNNILSAIIGYGHVALMHMAKDDPQRQNIEHMLDAADRAAHLSKQLLLFSRKQVIERKPADLNHVVRTVQKFLKRVIGEDVACKTILKDEQISVLADSHQLEQVLMNLATNARDAMPDGGSFTIMTEQINVNEAFIAAHGYGKPGLYAMITVSDTGKGMDEETRKRIFEPFFTTKEVGKGTGLGLSVVYGIIKQHEGFIHVYSESGRGTTFRIYLPVIAPEAREEIATRQIEVPVRGTETVLLAEDDEALRRLSRTVLTEYGYTVVEAVDGEEAVRKFMENGDKIHILLFDLIMPRMNGKEAYDEIRQIKPDMKVIFASGHAPDIIQQKASLEAGAYLIFKPVSPFDLLKKMRGVLDGTI